jgi:hypothetical protein
MLELLEWQHRFVASSTPIVPAFIHTLRHRHQYSLCFVISRIFSKRPSLSLSLGQQQPAFEKALRTVMARYRCGLHCSCHSSVVRRLSIHTTLVAPHNFETPLCCQQCQAGTATTSGPLRITECFVDNTARNCAGRIHTPYYSRVKGIHPSSIDDINETTASISCNA